MMPVLLIAANFLRAHRWPILVLLLWVLVLSALGLAVDVHREREDLLIVFKQLAVYAIAFALFLGGSAIHNERKSRWIFTISSMVSNALLFTRLCAGCISRYPVFHFSESAFCEPGNRPRSGHARRGCSPVWRTPGTLRTCLPLAGSLPESDVRNSLASGLDSYSACPGRDHCLFTAGFLDFRAARYCSRGRLDHPSRREK